MKDATLLEKFHRLPAQGQEAVARFIDFLLSETKRPKNGAKTQKRSGFGSWKGIHMSDDFDAPLEDFKEYME